MTPNLSIRRMRDEDEERLGELSEYTGLPVPDVHNPLYFAKVVTIAKDKVVGIGLAKVTSEFILLLDPKEPLSVRVKSLEMIMGAGVMCATKEGLDDAHVFVSNPELTSILKGKYGFIDCDGTSLYLGLGGG